MRQVTEGDRDRVGCIRWAERPLDAEQCLDHALDLSLVGPAEPGHGLLDLVGGVLHDLAASRGGFDHDDPGGLGHGDGCAGVHLEQHALDGHDRRAVFGQQGA